MELVKGNIDFATKEETNHGNISILTVGFYDGQAGGIGCYHPVLASQTSLLRTRWPWLAKMVHNRYLKL